MPVVNIDDEEIIKKKICWKKKTFRLLLTIYLEHVTQKREYLDHVAWKRVYLENVAKRECI